MISQNPTGSAESAAGQKHSVLTPRGRRVLWAVNAVWAAAIILFIFLDPVVSASSTVDLTGRADSCQSVTFAHSGSVSLLGAAAGVGLSMAISVFVDGTEIGFGGYSYQSYPVVAGSAYQVCVTGTLGTAWSVALSASYQTSVAGAGFGQQW